MARSPAVLMLDDGELDDIQELLDDIGVAYARIRGGAIVDGTPPPTDLLISTPRRIEAVNQVDGGQDVGNPLRLVVVNEDSNALREQLRRSGFDYLVRRPVHPEALRLLLLRAIYRGDERRSQPRVAVGFDVAYRTGLRSRRAVLADLSIGGCRLISHDALTEGRRIRMNIPDAIETNAPITISGRVLRVDPAEDPEAESLRYSAAVLFEEMDEAAQALVQTLIEDLALGPATLGPAAATSIPDPIAGDEALPQADDEADCAMDAAVEVDLEMVTGDDVAEIGGSSDPAERRGGRRAAYVKTVPAFGKRALRVLVGRDLSVGGMRIDPLPGLHLGDRLHLAIYGDAGESPFLVWATVHRDDGERGMALSFDSLSDEMAGRLDRLVGALPAVESLHDTEAQAMGTVMSEILQR